MKPPTLQFWIVLLMFVMACALAGCAGDRQVVLTPPVLTPGQGLLARQPARQVTLLPVKDARQGNRMLGQTTAAFGVKMGDNFSSTDVPALIYDTVANEFRAAGHSVGTSGVPVQITIHEFQVRTDTTPIYWDIIATAKIDLQIGPTTRHYESRATTREWVNPGAEQMSTLLKTCLSDIGGQIRNDSALVAAFTATPA